MYILGNCLNFYPNGNLSPCPFFVDGNYYLISLVRDGSTNQIKIYVNGTLFNTYNDAGNTYTSSGSTTPILFFRDDNTVPCEVRAGHIRYLSLSPVINTDAQILNVWNNICTVILPLTLEAFDVNLINNSQVAVNWKTSGELNTRYFDIERSTDGRNFSVIGSQPASNTAGTHNYNYIDRVPVDGASNYYRLKQIDIDGKVGYSPVRKIIIGKSGQSVQISYEPGISVVWLKIPTEWLNSTVTVFSANGQALQSFVISQTIKQVNIGSYPPGIYSVQMVKNGNRIVEKLIKY
jgi:hypothetical protein